MFLSTQGMYHLFLQEFLHLYEVWDFLILQTKNRKCIQTCAAFQIYHAVFYSCILYAVVIGSEQFNYSRLCLAAGCDGAPLLPLLFVVVNMGFNISLLHLLKISSAVVSCLASTFSGMWCMLCVFLLRPPCESQ